jgi:nicotinamidase-related amidase
MADLRTIDRDHTAVLIMDYQQDIVQSVAAHQPLLLERAAAVLSGARLAGVPVIYVVVRFRSGYPEVSDRNPLFRGLKAAGRLGEGTPGVEIHPQVAPQPTEVIVTKRRVGAFATTDLETILRARQVTCLVLLGVATSGVVLSTVRWAADADYELIVLEDCCADGDEEVHRVLMHKVFPRQATVVQSQAFLQALAPGAEKPYHRSRCTEPYQRRRCAHTRRSPGQRGRPWESRRVVPNSIYERALSKGDLGHT